MTNSCDRSRQSNTDSIHSKIRKFAHPLVGVAIITSLASCTTAITNRYEATAQTRYTWQVEYHTDPAKDRPPRYATFASTELLNRNGEKPVGAVTGPDDRGLWWGALPPRPAVDDIEQQQQFLEQPSAPQLIKSVDYRITFQQEGMPVTLPTNYDVYREVVKAKRSGAALELTFGLGDRTVEKAEPR